jgi:hypothetical protein
MESADQAIHSLFAGAAPELHLLLGIACTFGCDSSNRESNNSLLLTAVELINNATVKSQESSDSKESYALAKQALRFLRIKAAKVIIELIIYFFCRLDHY